MWAFTEKVGNKTAHSGVEKEGEAAKAQGMWGWTVQAVGDGIVPDYRERRRSFTLSGEELGLRQLKLFHPFV